MNNTKIYFLGGGRHGGWLVVFIGFCSRSQENLMKSTSLVLISFPLLLKLSIIILKDFSGSFLISAFLSFLFSFLPSYFSSPSFPPPFIPFFLLFIF